MRRRININRNENNPLNYRYTVQLSFHDLQQFNKDYLSGLSVTLLIQLCLKLLVDLKEAHDRLNQNPQNSSRPPSSQPPWDTHSKTDNEKNNSNDDELSDSDPTLTEEDYLSESEKHTTTDEEEKNSPISKIIISDRQI